MAIIVFRRNAAVMQRQWLLTLGLISMVAVAAAGSEYCMSLDPEPPRFYAEKSAYDDVRGQAAAEDETMPGCTPLHMYMVSRHASRYNSVSSQAELRDKLTPLRDLVLNSTNELCEEDRVMLRDWVPQYDPTKDTPLAPRGWREFNGVGERYTTRVPGLLARPYGSDDYHFQHTDYSGRGDRTLDTARAFAEGVWGSFDDVDFVESEQPDWLIHFYQHCEKYIEEVRSQPLVEHEAFIHGPYMEATLRRMETRLGLGSMSLTNDIVNLIYESCRVEYLVQDGMAPWCVALTPEDIDVIDYSEDLYYYWLTSYPYSITYEQACPLVEDMVNQFHYAMANQGGLMTGLFGHLSTMNTFFARLGLFHEPEHLTATNFEEMSSRDWRMSLHNSMGSNAVFILYQCEAAPTYRLKTFVNEKPVTLPQCTEPVCDLDDVMSVWGPIAENCDIEEICKVTIS